LIKIYSTHTRHTDARCTNYRIAFLHHFVAAYQPNSNPFIHVMCEFCNNPFASNKDAQHVEFAGFFSADAIDAAVARRAKQQQDASDDDEGSEDSDGT
jgi:hypothetical protein